MGRRERMAERLAGIEAKLDRAQQQFADMQERALTWAAEEESWEFPAKVNEGERRYVISMRLVKPAPPVLALMVDEVVHHLRSSLDHLAGYLVEWSRGRVGRTAWPIMTSRFQWEREVEPRKRRWEIWRKIGGRSPISGTTPEVRAFIEGKQPYNGSRKARNDPLFELNDLWNAYKHRILNPVHIQAIPEGTWDELFHPIPEVAPVDFKWVLKPGDELKPGAERTLAVLVFPKDRPLPEMKMKGKIPVKPFIGDGKLGGRSLEEDVDLIRGIVAEAIDLFPLPD